jgi:predicted Fe-Mo cluster-binding NifX family protein
MKIAFPTEDDKGVESTVYGHFGSAGFFTIVETEDGAVETIVNQDREHMHGNCQPLKALGGQEVDAVVVGGIGGAALRGLQAGGIRVYRGVEGTVNENLRLIKAGHLPEFTLDQTCAGHGPRGGCSHQQP